MPPFGPISRNDLIRYLKRCGFGEPQSGGKHQYMEKGNLRIRLPNPHRGDINRQLLSSLLKQAGISREEWESL